MKKGTVLNSEISAVISRLGHTDTLVVCDAGLPIPHSTARIDMALTQGRSHLYAGVGRSDSGDAGRGRHSRDGNSTT